MDDLFAELERANADARREEMLRYSWEVWGWGGPSVGGLCDIDLPVVETVEGSPLYCYAEQARLTLKPLHTLPLNPLQPPFLPNDGQPLQPGHGEVL